MPKVFPKVSIDSKRLSVPCFSYQTPFKKLITRANMSCTPFDIQRSCDLKTMSTIFGSHGFLECVGLLEWLQ
jgi:hypothetical protein